MAGLPLEKMAMQMLAEMYSMLIRYTEIVDLGDGRDDALLRIKDSYESLLLKDFTAPQHRGVYKIAAISDDRSVQEFFSYKAKLEEKLAPLLAERARIHHICTINRCIHRNTDRREPLADDL